MTDEQKTELLESLMSELRTKDRFYSLEGPTLLTVQLPDGTFRRKEGFGTDYIPVTGRQGKRNAIFVFEPEDPQEWNTVEVEANKMDETFPLFLDDVRTWALKRYIDSCSSRIKTLDEIEHMTDMISTIFKMEEEDIKKAEEADDSDMVSLPNFGMF